MTPILCGIVTFNTPPSVLERTLRAVSPQVDSIVLVDNGSKNILEIKQRAQEIVPKLTLICNDTNLGIAQALNQIFEFAVSHNYAWVLTLDHDSQCSAGLVTKLASHVEDNVGIIAPNVIYKNNEMYTAKGEGIQRVDWVITSASLTNVKAWRAIGGFDEKLFIDGVDKDFCWRLTKAGFCILKDYNVQLLHELGNLRCRKLFGRTIFVTNHSPLRVYYMARNVIYLDRKHHTHFSELYLTKLLIKIILFESNKKEKIFAIFRGMNDGLN